MSKTNKIKRCSFVVYSMKQANAQLKIVYIYPVGFKNPTGFNH